MLMSPLFVLALCLSAQSGTEETPMSVDAGVPGAGAAGAVQAQHEEFFARLKRAEAEDWPSRNFLSMGIQGATSGIGLGFLIGRSLRK